MFKALLVSALVAGASAGTVKEPTPTTKVGKVTFNKVKVNATWDKDLALPKLNKTKIAKDLVKLAPNVSALKGEVEDSIAAKLEGLAEKMDAVEKLAKSEAALAKPNKTAILAKLDAFKAVVAETINATLHKKDPPAPLPPVTTTPPATTTPPPPP